jgi:tRNA 2-selenouridine synthase
MTWREIEADELQKLRRRKIIDVRSPCEFAAERIPAAINVPLLDDDERAQVGTSYAKDGEIVARRLALRIISPKIPAIVDRILELKSQDSSLVVHCWRGGLRSEAVVSFLAIVGIDTWRLKGGYKAWRRHVLSRFEANDYNFPSYILHGQTGTGKTEIMLQLSRLGAQVLDLEKLCNHRGSVFGDFGLGEQPTQKNFEGELFEQIESFDQRPVFIEAESRKVGKLMVPDVILKRIQSGRKILVTCPIKARIQRLMDDYLPIINEQFLEQTLEVVSSLKERIGKEAVMQIRKLTEQGKLQEALELLLVQYYDPMYNKHIEQNQPFDLTVVGNNPVAAAKRIYEWSMKSNVTA